MIGYIFVSYYFFQNIKLTNIHIYILSITPYIIYLFNSGNYPNFIMEFFYSYSDKFRFMKGADILMTFFFCLFILKDELNDKKYLVYLNITASLLLPISSLLVGLHFSLDFCFFLFQTYH